MTRGLQRLGLSVLHGGARSAHVVAAGELDVETVDLLQDTLCETRRRARLITLDLSAVTFLDLAGVAFLHRAVVKLGAQLSIVPPAGGPARRLLQTSGAQLLLPV